MHDIARGQQRQISKVVVTSQLFAPTLPDLQEEMTRKSQSFTLNNQFPDAKGHPFYWELEFDAPKCVTRQNTIKGYEEKWRVFFRVCQYNRLGRPLKFSRP